MTLKRNFKIIVAAVASIVTIRILTTKIITILTLIITTGVSEERILTSRQCGTSTTFTTSGVNTWRHKPVRSRVISVLSRGKYDQVASLWHHHWFKEMEKTCRKCMSHLGDWEKRHSSLGSVTHRKAMTHWQVLINVFLSWDDLVLEIQLLIFLY